MDQEREVNSHPITTSEAFFLLDPLTSRFKNTRSAAYKVFKETHGYAGTFARVRDPGLMEDLRHSLAELGFTEQEIAVLGTLLPQTSGDAKIYIPSITRLPDSVIESGVEKLSAFS